MSGAVLAGGDPATTTDPAVSLSVDHSATANPARGEASLTVAGLTLTLRPTFSALVKVEQELGPLLQWVERASIGGVGIADIVALFWHCLTDTPGEITRDKVGEALVEAGLSAVTPILKILITQILKGL